MKTLLSICTLFVFSLIACAQTAPDTLWTRTYGGDTNDEGRDIIQTSDGNLVAVGHVLRDGWDVFLAKLDLAGNTMWTRQLELDGSQEAYSIREMRSGGFAICGYSSTSNNGDLYLIITDSTGVLVDTHSYGGWNQDAGRNMQITQDGGFILVGYNSSSGNGTRDCYIVKTDSTGQIEWSRTYGGPQGEGANAVIQTHDGGYIVAGSTNSYGAGNGDMYVIRMESDGDTLWTRTYGGTATDVAWDIRQTPDGGYILAGYTSSYGGTYSNYYIIRTNSLGDTLWTRVFSGDAYEEARSISLTADSDYVVAGFTTSFGYGYPGDIWLMRINDIGDTLWSRTYGQRWLDMPYKIITAPDGGYVVVGAIDTQGTYSTDFYVLKFKPETMPCILAELPFLDNFDSPELDSCWTWIREDTSHWSLTERPGWMRIVGGGQLHLYLNNATNVLLRSVQDTNFTIETKIEATQTNQDGAALIFYHDDANFVDIIADRQTGLIRTHSEISDDIPFTADLWQSWSPVYLRLSKLGNHYSAFASPDGIAWSYLATWERELSSNGQIRCGIWTGGWNPDAITADFDYFRVDSIPGTMVCGDVSGVWDSTGSPYYVTCDVTVPAGQTLTIQPGVQVLFTGHYKFNVFGNLQAIGTEQDSIVFTRAFPTEESKWASLRLISAQDTNRLRYCIVEHGRTRDIDYGIGGGLLATNCILVVDHCTFRNNYASDDGGGCVVGSSPYCKITNCVFANNNAADIGGVVAGGGLQIGWNGNYEVDHCIFANNHSNGNGGGLALDQIGWYPQIDSFRARVSHCSFYGNSCGGVGSAIYVTSNADVRNIISWHNIGTQPVSHVQGDLTVVYSDIQGGYPGTGNIDVDPLFVDTANGDYHLQSNSPCIDAGDPGSPLDPDSTIADMGAFPYYHPCLKINPDVLDFGQLDLGTDSTMQIALRNPTSVPIPVTAISNALPEFMFDTTALNGQVAPFSTYPLNVTLAPVSAGAYLDTLTIVAQQECDTIMQIPLSGAADIILPPVDSLVIRKGPMNGILLDWAPVTHTISGQPVEGVAYIIYGATSPDGPFVPFGYAATNSFVHPFILNSQAVYFYQVTADLGGRAAVKMLAWPENRE